jgi:peptide/nickel transport system ATP-binding protein
VTEPVLHISGLSARIGNTQVLHDAGLTIKPGERVALVGPSGAGKTTLLRLALGLDRPARRVAGMRMLAGQNIDAVSARALRSLRAGAVGFVPQNPASGLDPLDPLSVAWAQTARARGCDPAPAARAAALAAVGLPDCGDAYPHHWSRGMLQRFLIALARLGDPALIVMDEPTSALDPVIAAEIMQQEADRATARGAALLIVTHHAGLAEGIATRVVEMAAGRVTADRATRPGSANHCARCDTCPEGPGACVLDIGGLSVRQGRRQTLSDVTLHIHEGEALVVLGESGAGKTTLLRALAGLVPKTVTAARIAPCALVLQDPIAALCPAHNVVTAIAEPLLGQGVPRANAFVQAAEAAAEVGLPKDLLSRLPHRLSLGQAQRVCIARALVARPRLVLLDEPLSALDPANGAEVTALLGRLRARHRLALLIVTHDLGFARAIADRIAVLRDGQIIEQASADAFFAAPTSDYGRALVAAGRVLGDLETAA